MRLLIRKQQHTKQNQIKFNKINNSPFSNLTSQLEHTSNQKLQMLKEVLFSCELIQSIQHNLQKQLKEFLNSQANQNDSSNNSPFETISCLNRVKQCVLKCVQASTETLSTLELCLQQQALAVKTGAQQFQYLLEQHFGVAFRLTERQYDLALADYDIIPRNNFGNEFHVADWNDLQAVLEALSQSQKAYLPQYLGYCQSANDFGVLFNGKKSHSSQRFYFASLHNHRKPPCYLSHGQLDDHLFTLGSWLGSRRILCVAKRNNLSINRILENPGILMSVAIQKSQSIEQTQEETKTQIDLQLQQQQQQQQQIQQEQLNQKNHKETPQGDEQTADQIINQDSISLERS